MNQPRKKDEKLRAATADADEAANRIHWIGGFEVDTDPRPTAHKSISDYGEQLKAKKKRPKRRN